MILGITGNFEKGKREILNKCVSSEVSNDFFYEPIPPQYKNYSEKEKIRYFEEISKNNKEGKIVLIDDIETLSQYKEFKKYFKNDFKIFSVELSPSIKYLNYVQQKMKKGFAYLNRKPFQEYRSEIESKKDDYSKLINEADLKIISSTKSGKGLESEVLDYIRNYNK